MTENPLDYSFVFEKEGKFNDLWLAATNERRFNQKNKRIISQYDVFNLCKSIEAEILGIKETIPVVSVEKRKCASGKKPPKKRRRTEEPEATPEKSDASSFNLKLASNLMMGAVRIWRSQVNQLYEDSKLAVSKQASYNAIVHAQTVEEERRKERVNYAKMLDNDESTTKGKKKNTNIDPKLTLNEFEHYEENIRAENLDEQNKVCDALTLNTAQVDQITLRETILSPFTLSRHQEINFSEFEPLAEEEINLLLQPNSSNLEIDEVRDAPQMINPENDIQSVLTPMPESVELEVPVVLEDPPALPPIEIAPPTIELPIEAPVEQQPMQIDENFSCIEATYELVPSYEANEVMKVQDLNKNPKPQKQKSAKDLIFENVNEHDQGEQMQTDNSVIPIQPNIEIGSPIEASVPNIYVPIPKSLLAKVNEMNLKKLKKKSKAPKTVKKGLKRKMTDEITKLSFNQMTLQLKDTSDIVHKNKLTILPPLKRFRIDPAAVLFERPCRCFRGEICEELFENFSEKIKFLSYNESTKKRKIQAALKKSENGPAKKKLRKSNEISLENPNINVADFVQNQIIEAFPPVIEVPLPPPQIEEQPEVPVKMPENNSVNKDAPVEAASAPQETPPDFMPGFEHILKELLEEEQNPDQNAETATQKSNPDELHWKKVKADWGQASILKKLITIFRKTEIDFPTIEVLIENECTKKVAVVTFSSLIHLKAKKYLALEKNDKLKIIRIKQGPKLEQFLSKSS
ncbi:titin-like [Culicoides brevitarsis]|uniref:titin-like n=1 Tax=Culicoides brevitarsis TaxID=469753 RepID=UPI00307C5286